MSKIATDADQVQFDSIWRSAQPTAVQSLYDKSRNYTPGQLATLQTEALILAHEGFLIDPMILVWGWDPYERNKISVENGYTWVPSVLMPPVNLAPGLKQGDIQPYDPTMIPRGAVTVTLDMDLLPHLFPAPKGK